MHTFVQTHRQRQQTHATDAVAHERALSSKTYSERARPTRVFHDFSRIPVCAKEPFHMNPAWKISAPGDFSEREADRIADQVVRTAEPAVRIGEEEDLQTELCPDERARRRQMPEEKTVLARSEVKRMRCIGSECRTGECNQHIAGSRQSVARIGTQIHGAALQGRLHLCACAQRCACPGFRSVCQRTGIHHRLRCGLWLRLLSTRDRAWQALAGA